MTADGNNNNNKSDSHICDKTPKNWSCEYNFLGKKYWTIDGPDQESGVWKEIFYCPWCGVRLENE